MLRRLNSTGRKKIDAGMVAIALLPEEKPPAFTATLELDALELPGAARVFIEAQRQNAVERSDLGTVAGLTPARLFPLLEMEVDDALQFRVKVVEPETARLLASRSRIRPGDTEEGGLIPLMAVREDDLGAEPWRTEIDEASDRAVLVLNARIPGAMASLKTPGLFQSLVLPAAFRQVLLRLWAEREEADEDDDGWRARWLRFAEALAGAEPDWEDDAGRDRWIDRACEAFAARHKLLTQLVEAG